MRAEREVSNDERAADKSAEKSLKKQKREDRKYRRWFTFLRFVSNAVRLLYPYRIHRARKSYDDRTYIFLCNHYSMLDVMLPVVVTKKPVHFIAKIDLWKANRFLNWFCTKCRCIPASRDGSGMDAGAVMKAMRYLKNGENIEIFPEGTRNKSDEDLLPFKGGFAAIAIKTRTPIVPIVQMSKLKPFKVDHVFVLEPIEFSEYYGKKLTEEDIAECENKLRERMLAVFVDFRAKKKKRHIEKEKK